MRIVVFLGPSLPLAEAAAMLDADFRPPIGLGDLCDLLIHDDPPDVVGIVDGLFEQVPTLWHKEILFALDRGVHVFGASSMGALRAAELHPFGMRGVGEVFERFRSGVYTDDDEVAIVHASAEDGYRPLSDAMVNIRQGLERAERAGLLTGQQREELTAAAKADFYPDRSWPGVLSAATRLGFPRPLIDDLREFVRRERPDVKRADAIALLETIAGFAAGGLPASVASSFTFEPTYYWDKLVTIVRDERHRAEIAGLLAPQQAVTDAVTDAALFDLLTVRESVRLGLPGAGDSADPAAADLRQVLARHYRAELSGHTLHRLRAAPHAGDEQAATVRTETSEGGVPWDISRSE